MESVIELTHRVDLYKNESLLFQKGYLQPVIDKILNFDKQIKA